MLLTSQKPDSDQVLEFFAFGNAVLSICGPGVNTPWRHQSMVLMAASAVMVTEVDLSPSPFPFVPGIP